MSYIKKQSTGQTILDAANTLVDLFIQSLWLDVSALPCTTTYYTVHVLYSIFYGSLNASTNIIHRFIHTPFTSLPES